MDKSTKTERKPKKTAPTNRTTTRVVSLQNTDDVKAFLHYKTNNEGTVIAVWGYGVISGSTDRADGCKTHNRKVRYGDVRSAEIGVCDAITQDWYREKRGASEPLSAKKGSLYDILHKLYESSYDTILRLVCDRCGFADSTARSALAYLLNSIAKRVDSPEEDMYALADMLYEQANNRTKDRKNAGTPRTVGNEIKRAIRAFKVIKAEYPQELWAFKLDIPVKDLGKPSEKEQKKSISPRERVLVAVVLLELAMRGFVLAFGGALMFFLGLRRGEAAAPLMGSIASYENGRYGSYLVDYQIQSDLTRLKTDNSYRWVVLPYIAMELVQIRVEQLKAKGLDDKTIRSIPFTSETDTPGGYVQPGKIADFMKQLLIRCGVAEDKFRPVNDSEIEFVEKYEDGDYVGHLTRRDFSSRGLTDCGCSPALMDYLLGHKSAELGDRYFELTRGTQEWAQMVAGILERYVFLPEYSVNPAVQPVEIDENRIYQLDGNVCYRFIAREDCVVRFVIRNTEPNDVLECSTQGMIVPRSVKATVPLEEQEGRARRFITCNTALESEEIKELKAIGREIADEMMKESW